MKLLSVFRIFPLPSVLLITGLLGTAAQAADFDVRTHGATGDGRTLDSPAIRRAIDAAAQAGGGTVRIPAGRYVCGTIPLRSNVTLRLEPGSVLVATEDKEAYEPAETYDLAPKRYQDYGHSHWRNSLIVGVDVTNVAIVGSGLIDGTHLTTGRGKESNIPLPGNKAISLLRCRNVILRDFSVLRGGWFALLATGVDNLTLDNLLIDTDRDGFDIDGCNGVRIVQCAVNAPDDDAICLKSSYALGVNRATENVVIANCTVSGYDVGTLLDGTRKRETAAKPGNLPTGRIKFGTESNGGFKNIAITNCVFDYSCGIAIETVDGAIVEDVVIDNITMRDVINAPIFLRLGARMRAPEGTAIGTLRRVSISNIVASRVAPFHGIMIAGLPDHPVEDVSLNNISITYVGGGTREQSQRQVPEYAKEYPEPGYFGTLPSYGLFVRHAKNVRISNVVTRFEKEDARPAALLEDVDGIVFRDVDFQTSVDAPVFVIRDVGRLSVRGGSRISDADILEKTTGTIVAGAKKESR